jgi:DNA polymerase III sliding clamp (beta) subunit (PCNA family)
MADSLSFQMGGRMTRVVFETATIADAIKKAERIAPTKGSAFDKAAGIVLTIDPKSGLVVVRATDLRVYSMEWVTSLSIEGDEVVEWRVPSKLFATVLAGLPIGTEKTVTLEEVTNGRNRFVQLTSGRTKAKFNLMVTDYYPVWDVFNPDDLFEVDDVGGRIAMVEWSASKADDPPLSGVHFDGKVVKATDQYKLTIAPLLMPSLTEPITVPAGILGQILKQTGEVQLGVRDDGLLLIMPEPTVQIMATVFGLDYPDTARIENFRERPNRVKVHKAPLLEIMRRANAFSGNERFPILRIFFGKEEIAVMMDTKEVGVLADVMDVPGYCDHPRVEMRFGPSNIIDAIDHVPNEVLTIGYDKENPKAPVHIDGGSGYEAWIMPRKGIDAEGAP